jgi:hypothetical protein
VGKKGGERKSQLNKGRLPIFIRVGRVGRVDACSTSTIVGKGVANRMGWLKEAKKYSCRMTTVTGSQEMLGELEFVNGSKRDPNSTHRGNSRTSI